jgi:glycosyltransferase involved in cell wall biosynthesis
VPPLSIFIITRNEADRIGRTIQAVSGLSDDIVVVDSGSDDGTQAIAAELGARVIANGWPGYGPQKRFAEDQCRHPWLLNLDADEVVPDDLAAEIAALFAAGEPAADAYRLRIAEIFPGEPAPHRFAYALTPVRLYRKDKGRYSPSPVHDRVDLAPAEGHGPSLLSPLARRTDGQAQCL